MNVGIYKWSYINRFISADTIVQDYTDPQSLNRYAYARNNPLRYRDPTGHYFFQEDPGTETHSVWGSKPLITCANWDCDLPPGGEPTVEDFITPVAALYAPAIAYGAAPAVPAATYASVTSFWGWGTRLFRAAASWLCWDGDCLNETEVIYDATIKEAGYIQNGVITINSRLSELERLRMLYHEQVHLILTPRGWFAAARARISFAAYQNSALLQYAEEALAESVAQYRTGGSIIYGLRFPFEAGYVRPSAVALESAAGALTVDWIGGKAGEYLQNLLD